MSLDKGIRYGKEHRRQYYGVEAIDKSCRPHGSCEWCEENRRYTERRLNEAADIDEKEWRRTCMNVSIAEQEQ